MLKSVWAISYVSFDLKINVLEIFIIRVEVTTLMMATEISETLLCDSPLTWLATQDYFNEL
jgi:hypothetical protein